MQKFNLLLTSSLLRFHFISEEATLGDLEQLIISIDHSNYYLQNHVSTSHEELKEHQCLENQLILGKNFDH